MSLAEGVHQLLEDCSKRNSHRTLRRAPQRAPERNTHERICHWYNNREGAGAADINTTSYENVKNTWTKRGIWNRRWGILPGMSWKHEEPLEEEAADGPAPVPANPLVNGGHEAGEAPAIRIFGSPPPVQSNYRQASGALNSSQQGPLADIDSAGSENGDAERSSSTSNSPPPNSGKRVLHPTTEQALLPSKRKASHKDGQPANASLDPVHSSKVTKAAGKRRGPQRRLNISQKVSSDFNARLYSRRCQPHICPSSHTESRRHGVCCISHEYDDESEVENDVYTIYVNLDAELIFPKAKTISFLFSKTVMPMEKVKRWLISVCRCIFSEPEPSLIFTRLNVMCAFTREQEHFSGSEKNT